MNNFFVLILILEIAICKCDITNCNSQRVSGEVYVKHVVDCFPRIDGFYLTRVDFTVPSFWPVPYNLSFANLDWYPVLRKVHLHYLWNYEFMGKGHVGRQITFIHPIHFCYLGLHYILLSFSIP